MSNMPERIWAWRNYGRHWAEKHVVEPVNSTTYVRADVAKAQRDELLEVLKNLSDDVGWRGPGSNDLHIFYCEFCRQGGQDSRTMSHTASCHVSIARAVIAKAEEKEKQ